MQTGLIIFARYDSSRLPGKVLMPLEGQVLLGRVLDRARRVSGQYTIVIATSDRTIDDPIADFAKTEGIVVFRGALDDVAGRALACCETFGFDRFARICGDRPFLPAELIDMALLMQQEKELDLATNALVKTYPAGTMTEVVTREAMQRVCDETDDAEDREHVTKYIYDHAKAFRIGNLSSGHQDWAKMNLSLDTLHDMERTKWMLGKMGKYPEKMPLKNIIILAKKWEAEH